MTEIVPLEEDNSNPSGYREIVPLEEPNSNPYSEKQTNIIAATKAYSDRNLQPNSGIDPAVVYSTTKSQLVNGQEQLVRESAQAAENSDTLQGASEIFKEAVADGDVNRAQAAVDLAKEVAPPDSMEFTALDSFRKDLPAADFKTQDESQALLASSLRANQNKDKDNNKGILYNLGVKEANLVYSAQQHGNTLTTDVMKGIANGLPAAIEGFADNVNRLLPDAYWKMINENNPEELRKSVLTQVNKNTLGRLDTGDVGKVAETATSFIIAMAIPLAKLPKAMGVVGATSVVEGTILSATGQVLGATTATSAVATATGITKGLNWTRVMASAIIADAAVFQGMDSAVKSITDAYPTVKVLGVEVDVKNTLTSWLGDRREDSPWENKAKQVLEATGLNLIGEGVVFAALKGIKLLKGAKLNNSPVEVASENIMTVSTVMGDRPTGTYIASVKMLGEDLDPITDALIQKGDVAATVIPSMAKTPLDVKPEVGLMGDVIAKLNEVSANKQVAKFYSEVNIPDRLSANELEGAQKATLNRLSGLYGENRIADVKYETKEGLNTITLQVGRKSGGGFKTEASAIKAGNQIDGSSVIKLPNGEYFVTKTHAVRETGFTNPWDLASSVVYSNPLGRQLAHGGNYIPDEILEGHHLAENSGVQIKNKYLTPIVNKYRAVNKDDFNTINNILAMGRDTIVEDAAGNKTRGSWYTPREFAVHYERMTGKLPTTKVSDSYKAYREMSDLQHALENHQQWVRLNAKGFEELHSAHADFDFRGHAILKDNLTLTEKYHVYSPSDKKVFRPNELTPDELAIKYSDHRLMELEGDTFVEGHGVVKYVLMNKDDFSLSMLDYGQVGYAAGGRVVYAGKYFAKQAVVDTLEDGTKVARNPLVPYTSASRQEMIEGTTLIENARNAYKSIVENTTYKPVIGVGDNGVFKYSSKGGKLTVKEAEDIIGKTSAGDIDNLTKMVEEGSFRLDTPWEVTRDRELPLSYDKDIPSYIDSDHSGQGAWLVSHGKSRFKARTLTGLRNLQDEAADVISPFDTLSESYSNLARYGMLGDHLDRVSEQFASTAKAYGLLKPEFETASVSKIFSAGANAIQPPAGTTLMNSDYQTALSILKSLQTGLGFKGDIALQKDAILNSAAEWLDSKGIPILEKDVTKSYLNPKAYSTKRAVADLSSADPIQAAKSFMFQTNFGLFAVKQFITQGLGGTVTTAMFHPVSATQGLMSSLVHANYYFRQDAGEALSTNPAVLALMGFTGKNAKADYTKMIKVAQDIGFVVIDGSYVDIGAQKALTGRKGIFFDMWDWVKDKGAYAFRTGEAMNQIVAFQAAYKNFQKQFPTTDTGSKEAAGWISREASKLTVYMKSSIKRELLGKGVLTVPLQYLNLPLNLLEATTIGKKFTAKQKGLFWASQIALWGTDNDIANSIEDTLSDMGVKVKGLATYITDGLIQSLVNQTDFKIDLGGGLNPFGALNSVYERLATEDAKFWPIMGGAIGSKIGQIEDHATKAWYLLNSKDGKPLADNFKLTRDAISEIAKVTASWGAYSRGELAKKDGTIRSSRTNQVLVDGINNKTATAMMLGLQSKELSDLYKLDAPRVRDIERKINDYANSVSYFTSKAAEQPNTPEGRRASDMHDSAIDYIIADEPYADKIMQKSRDINKYTRKIYKDVIERKKDKLRLNEAED